MLTAQTGKNDTFDPKSAKTHPQEKNELKHKLNAEAEGGNGTNRVDQRAFAGQESPRDEKPAYQTMTTAQISASAFLSSVDSPPSVPSYVVRAARGDASAFREMYQIHRRDVARLAARLLGPRSDLEDVIQEVFIQVFRSLSAFRGDSKFNTWLHRVTVNVVLMYLRAARSRPQLADAEAQEIDQQDEHSISPLENAAKNERLRALYRILDTLSDKKRAVFILHDLEGHPPAEIARLVDSNVLTVRTRLFYARREVYAAMAADPSLANLVEQLALQNAGRKEEP